MTDRKKSVAAKAPLVAGGTSPGAVPVPDHGSDEPMTARQAAILRELAAEAGEPTDGGLTRTQADQRIAHLKARLGK